MVNLPAPFSNCGATFWIKREDCNSGLAFGGNKVRKLEYVIPDALQHGADTLVTTGGLQSNHMRQTAAAAARYGLKVIVLTPHDVVPSEDSEYRKLGNIQVTDLISVEYFAGATEKQAIDELRAQGRKRYYIPPGASTNPFEQEKAMGIYFDTIIMPCASGSTLGGAIAGLKAIEKRGPAEPRKTRRLIGVMAKTEPVIELRDTVLKIARTAAEKIGLLADDIAESDILLDDRFHGGAYGHLDAYTAKCIKQLATLEGIIMGPVYTGKTLAGMIGMASNEEFSKTSNILLVHTGGQTALSAYPTLR
ncbi:tryptophan synthase beta subunit-like PLP-dependent enzyme [Aulographum hederae CBS 113979]|uniref:Tryptophan synthase beta subunit-like PLP-dependent enzyme n=1 Tax=Aulographum hederae CBS 113979 TaxID=1176131 RepID=A0A6G1GTX9_9PEZI|nr:tryptophan synthase beta subunit-like PLP-dependent enzyme [Aulographum hederae CBS 113979]